MFFNDVQSKYRHVFVNLGLVIFWGYFKWKPKTVDSDPSARHKTTCVEHVTVIERVALSGCMNANWNDHNNIIEFRTFSIMKVMI